MAVKTLSAIPGDFLVTSVVDLAIALTISKKTALALESISNTCIISVLRNDDNANSLSSFLEKIHQIGLVKWL